MSEHPSQSGEFVGGVQAPLFPIELPDGKELVFELTPRLKSLEWVSRKRPELFSGALFAFAQRRYDLAHATPELLPPRAWGVLSVISASDRLRIRLGGSWNPRAAPTTWPNQLFLATDDVAHVLWFLRVGLPVPAALIARRAFERWTLNVAHHFELSRQERETEGDYITRVWRSYARPGVPNDAGEWWAWLSELLHARAGHTAFGKAAAQPLRLTAKDNIAHHEAITAIIEVVLRHVRGGIDLLAEKQGLYDASLSLRAPHPTVAITEPFGLSFAFQHLEYFEVYRRRSQQWVDDGRAYRTEVAVDGSELATRPDATITTRGFLERRARAIERARHAFDIEKETLGSEFRPVALTSRVFRQRTIVEIARQICPATTGVERDALVVAAQAADGATYLWLEDSDDSIGCIRILLEQVARLRTHRKKPQRARRLEELGTASASRWLQEAGWGRLAVLMRALNEYAHLGLRSRKRGAAALLKEIQSDVHWGEARRGSAVDAAFKIFAFELHDRLTEIDPDIAREFSQQITLVDRDVHLRTIEEFLNRVFTKRAHDFGEPDYRPLLRDRTSG